MTAGRGRAPSLSQLGQSSVSQPLTSPYRASHRPSPALSRTSKDDVSVPNRIRRSPSPQLYALQEPELQQSFLLSLEEPDDGGNAFVNDQDIKRSPSPQHHERRYPYAVGDADEWLPDHRQQSSQRSQSPQLRELDLPELQQSSAFSEIGYDDNNVLSPRSEMRSPLLRSPAQRTTPLRDAKQSGSVIGSARRSSPLRPPPQASSEREEVSKSPNNRHTMSASPQRYTASASPRANGSRQQSRLSFIPPRPSPLSSLSRSQHSSHAMGTDTVGDVTPTSHKRQQEAQSLQKLLAIQSSSSASKIASRSSVQGDEISQTSELHSSSPSGPLVEGQGGGESYMAERTLQRTLSPRRAGRHSSPYLRSQRTDNTSPGSSSPRLVVQQSSPQILEEDDDDNASVDSDQRRSGSPQESLQYSSPVAPPQAVGEPTPKSHNDLQATSFSRPQIQTSPAPNSKVRSSINRSLKSPITRTPLSRTSRTREIGSANRLSRARNSGFLRETKQQSSPVSLRRDRSVSRYTRIPSALQAVHHSLPSSGKGVDEDFAASSEEISTQRSIKSPYSAPRTLLASRLTQANISMSPSSLRRKLQAPHESSQADEDEEYGSEMGRDEEEYEAEMDQDELDDEGEMDGAGIDGETDEDEREISNDEIYYGKRSDDEVEDGDIFGGLDESQSSPPQIPDQRASFANDHTRADTRQRYSRSSQAVDLYASTTSSEGGDAANALGDSSLRCSISSGESQRQLAPGQHGTQDDQMTDQPNSKEPVEPTSPVMHDSFTESEAEAEAEEEEETSFPYSLRRTELSLAPEQYPLPASSDAESLEDMGRLLHGQVTSIDSPTHRRVPTLSESRTSTASPGQSISNEQAGSRQVHEAAVQTAPLSSPVRATRSIESPLPVQESTREQSSASMNLSASMTMSNLLRHRSEILGTRPSMVEVCSLNREAAARAAAILKLHHKYVQYGSLETDVEDEVWSQTALLDPSIMERPDRSPSDRELSRLQQSMDDRTIDSALLEKEGGLTRSQMLNQHSLANNVESPVAGKGTGTAATTPCLPGAFPASTRRSVAASASNLHISYDKALKKVHKSTEVDRQRNANPFTNQDWTSLDNLLRAEIVAHANAILLDEAGHTDKGDALYNAALLVDKNALLSLFLELQGRQGKATADAEWSREQLSRRVLVLVRRFIRKIKDKYPALHVDPVDLESIDSTSRPATPHRTLVDDSTLADSAKRAAFRMVVESTPAPTQAMRKGVTIFSQQSNRDARDVSDSDSVYPPLPRTHTAKRDNTTEVSSRHVGEQSNDTFTGMSTSFSAASFAQKGLELLSSFWRRGNGESEATLYENQRQDSSDQLLERSRGSQSKVPRPEMPMQERKQQSQAGLSLPSISPMRRALEARVEDERSEMTQGGRLLDASRETAKAVPRRVAALSASRLGHSTASFPSRSQDQTSFTHHTPVRRIVAGRSTYVHPTALSMLSPNTHQEARDKAAHFRSSRAQRAWRSPRRPHREVNPGVGGSTSVALGGSLTASAEMTTSSSAMAIGSSRHPPSNNNKGAHSAVDPSSSTMPRFRNF